MDGKIHIVGGFVRDMIMGLEPKDKDFVVVGSSVDEMLANGFEQVGVSFPVFLKDGDEYALARRERSTGDGYVDFVFDTNGVSLEEDLFRRDLTINAISAQRLEDTEYFIEGEDGGRYAISDPYGGIDDIRAKIFRPVSEHFMEDPVRVLRVARLRARYGSEWTIHESLIEMTHKMVKKGVLNSLDPNRVWKELSRALMEQHPHLFFDSLLKMDTLHKVFPEIYKLKSALEWSRWHPEGDAFEHTMLVLKQSAINGFGIESRFAALVHDIGKGATKFENLPSHFGHDVTGAKMIEEFGPKYCVPNNLTKIASFAARHHMRGHELRKLSAKTFVKMFDGISLKKEKMNYVDVLHDVFVCDERGRLGSENNSVSHLAVIKDLVNAYLSVRFEDVFPDGQTNVNKIRDGLFKKRCESVAIVLKDYKEKM